jgi:hypothetical protein
MRSCFAPTGTSYRIITGPPHDCATELTQQSGVDERCACKRIANTTINLSILAMRSTNSVYLAVSVWIWSKGTIRHDDGQPRPYRA